MPTMALTNPETLRRYASVLRVPTEISVPIITHFIECIDKSGAEWTVSRFKSVKQDFINMKAGKPCESLWVSRKGDRFTGCFKGLQTWASKDFKRWSRAINMLQIYSTQISGTVTESQRKKFVDSVTYDNIAMKQFVKKYCDLLETTAREWFVPGWYPDPDPYLMFQTSETKREPHPNGKSYPEGSKTLECAYAYLEQTATGETEAIVS